MTEVPITGLRAHLADHINAALRGEVVYITSNGRRVAALVPVADAEKIEAGKR